MKTSIIALVLLALFLVAPPDIVTPDIQTAPGEFDVPVLFSGSDINAAVFELHYDGLDFVGYQMEAQPPFIGSCHDAGTALQCYLVGFSYPPATIPDGAIFDLRFETTTDSPRLSFSNVSFGSARGESVPGQALAGEIEIVYILPALPLGSVYIPLVVR